MFSWKWQESISFEKDFIAKTFAAHLALVNEALLKLINVPCASGIWTFYFPSHSIPVCVELVDFTLAACVHLRKYYSLLWKRWRHVTKVWTINSYERLCRLSKLMHKKKNGDLKVRVQAREKGRIGEQLFLICNSQVPKFTYVWAISLTAAKNDVTICSKLVLWLTLLWIIIADPNRFETWVCLESSERLYQRNHGSSCLGPDADEHAVNTVL